MSVPEEIRRVERPKNTVVHDTGTKGPKRFAVRERSYVKYIRGGNPQPYTGKTIGYIIDNKYVPKAETQPKSKVEPPALSYGKSALVKSVSQDILDNLLSVYDANNAFAIMAMATLKVIKPGITSKRMSTEYSRTFVCKDYPGAALSKNSITNLLQKIGMDGERRKQFYQLRMAEVSAKHHVAIDGTLKQDNSDVNDLSHFSRKSRIKNTKDVSVIYAYDIDLMEPVCAKVFPGNHIDAKSYKSFIHDNDVRKGLAITDKGFPVKEIEEELKERPDLHFLTPLKKNDIRIKNNDMLSFDGVLPDIEGSIPCKKKKIKGGRYLYSFRDPELACEQEKTYIEKHKEEKDFDEKKYAKALQTFGIIVFESDVDIESKIAYLAYHDRWKIELVFKRYKNDECLDKTNVQGDFTVIGAEFVNFIATLLTCRIIRKAEDAKLLDDMTYGELMDDLSSAWRKTDAPTDPATDDGGWVYNFNYLFDELEALGLSKPAPKPEPQKRGRKPKTKDKKE